MRKMRLISHAWAQAAREDALSLSGGTFALSELSIERVIVGPHVVRIRIGDLHPPRFMPSRVTNVVYLRRPPTCRCCGRRIPAGEKAVMFGYDPNFFNPDGRTSYIHEEPCL